jgi:hypothetical protein
LRDIERFRRTYDFFEVKLPSIPHKNTDPTKYYDRLKERPIIMSIIFCYLLKVSEPMIKE